MDCKYDSSPGGILVERAAAREVPEDSRTHFEDLLCKNHERLKVWCTRITRNPTDAADLAQEVLLKALQKFDSFRGDAKIGTWLYSIARNLHIDGVRARVTRAEVSLGIAEPAVRAFFPDAVERHDIRRQLNKTIRRSLTEMEIRILVLHYAQGVPLTKITKMLELRNRSGAKAYLVSGRRKLARALKNKLRLRV